MLRSNTATECRGYKQTKNALVEGGIGDPSTLGGVFEEFIEYCAIELMVGLAGLVCLGVSLAACGYRAKWFFKFLTIYGTPLLLVFPVGTAFGAFFLAYCFIRRTEFSAPPPRSSDLA